MAAASGRIARGGCRPGGRAGGRGRSGRGGGDDAEALEGGAGGALLGFFFAATMAFADVKAGHGDLNLKDLAVLGAAGAHNAVARQRLTVRVRPLLERRFVGEF